MIISVFISEQAITLAYLLHQAFGFAIGSSMGLSSYLIFMGIYYGAIFVAEDLKLRFDSRICYKGIKITIILELRKWNNRYRKE
jgi:hypothetical protein